MPFEDELPTVEDVCDIHAEIEAAYDLTYTGTRAHFAEVKIQRVLTRASEAERVYETAAVLLKDLAEIHVFEDGNKRTAWMAAHEYLDRHGVSATPSSEQVELVMKRLGRFDHSELAIWLETGGIDDGRLP